MQRWLDDIFQTIDTGPDPEAAASVHSARQLLSRSGKAEGDEAVPWLDEEEVVAVGAWQPVLEIAFIGKMLRMMGYDDVRLQVVALHALAIVAAQRANAQHLVSVGMLEQLCELFVAGRLHSNSLPEVDVFLLHTRGRDLCHCTLIMRTNM